VQIITSKQQLDATLWPTCLWPASRVIGRPGAARRAGAASRLRRRAPPLARLFPRVEKRPMPIITSKQQSDVAL
jgi:hypothetical protein